MAKEEPGDIEARIEMIEGHLAAMRIDLRKVFERLDELPAPEKPCPDTLRELCLWIHRWIDQRTEWMMAVHHELWPGSDPGDPPPPDRPPFGEE